MKVRYLCPPPSQVADIQEELEVAKEQLELSRDKEREMRRRSRPTPAAASCFLPLLVLLESRKHEPRTEARAGKRSTSGERKREART